MTCPTCDGKGAGQEVPRAADAVGNTMTLGNLVAYAALNYKRAVLRTGRIVEIEGDRVRVRGDHPPQRRVWEKAANVVRIG